jgi:CubicO group peptidase (beta-lactamase class C family)
VAAGAAPGIVVAVSWPGHRYVRHRRLGYGIRNRPNRTVYDLASLTKVVGLTTAVMWAVEEGRLDLDAPASRYLPAFQGPDTDSVTIRLLLAHASGLPAWRPLYLLAYSRPAVLAVADSTPLDTLPGARFTYSDIGAILLTQAVETVFGERIDSLLARRLFTSLGMRSTTYNSTGRLASEGGADRVDSLRNRMIRGQVHDENAWRMDGVGARRHLLHRRRPADVRGVVVAHRRRLCGPRLYRPQQLPPGSPERWGRHRRRTTPGVILVCGQRRPHRLHWHQHLMIRHEGGHRGARQPGPSDPRQRALCGRAAGRRRPGPARA